MSLHPIDELAEYASGTPMPHPVREHLAGCGTCRDRLEFWRSVGEGLEHDRPRAPEDAVALMLRRSATEPMAAAPPRTGLVRHARFVVQLLSSQLRLIRTSVWTASVLVMGVGVLLALPRTVSGRGWPEDVLAMIAPVVAAAGIAGACAPERDPGLEFLSATATSPRVVLMARVTLVFGYDLVLALISSVILAGVGVDPPGLASLIGAWLGPMALLSSLCLLLSVAAGTTVATTVVLALWVARLLTPGLVGTEWLAPVTRGIESLWSTNVITGLLSLVLLCASVVCASGIRRRPSVV